MSKPAKTVKLVNQNSTPVRPTQACPWHDSLRHQFWLVEIPVTRKLFAILDDKTPVARKFFAILWQGSFSLSWGKEAFCHPGWQDSGGKEAFHPSVARKLFTILWQGSFLPSWMTRFQWQGCFLPSCGKEVFCHPGWPDSSGKKAFRHPGWQDSNGKEAFCHPVARKLFTTLWQGSFLPSWMTWLQWQESFSPSWMMTPVARRRVFCQPEQLDSGGKETFQHPGWLAVHGSQCAESFHLSHHQQ